MAFSSFWSFFNEKSRKKNKRKKRWNQDEELKNFWSKKSDGKIQSFVLKTKQIQNKLFETDVPKSITILFRHHTCVKIVWEWERQNQQWSQNKVKTVILLFAATFSSHRSNLWRFFRAFNNKRPQPTFVSNFVLELFF